mgnify:CR=1 FL=1
MSLFGRDTRSLIREDGASPYSKPCYDPGPGAYDNEQITRMTHILNSKNLRPGVKKTSFGAANRAQGPWSYLPSPCRSSHVDPGPTTYCSGNTPSKSKALINYHQLYEKTLTEMERFRQGKDLSSMKVSYVTATKYQKPKDMTVERFKTEPVQIYKYLLGPGSYPDNGQFGSDLPTSHSLRTESFFGATSPVGILVGKKDEKEEYRTVNQEYTGPKAEESMRDYNSIYSRVSASMENERLCNDKTIFGLDLWRTKNKLRREARKVRSRFKAPAPHFGRAVRFPEKPPTSTYPDNLPGPGQYIGDQRANSLPSTNPDSNTSSFVGEERDTLKMMQRCGKAFPADNPGCTYKPNSSLYLQSFNIDAFRPMPCITHEKHTKVSKEMKDDMGSPFMLKNGSQFLPQARDGQTSLENTKWFSRKCAPSLRTIQEKYLIKRVASVNSPTLINLAKLKSSFFKPTNSIKGGHLPVTTKIFDS